MVDFWYNLKTIYMVQLTVEKLIKDLGKNLTNEIEGLALATKRGFDEVHKRFEQVDRRFDGIDTRLDRIEGHMFGHGNRLDNLEDKMRVVYSKLKL